MSARKPYDMELFEKELERARTQLYRDMPWRTPEADGSFDPYKILVSEFMLQQTQVARVIPKYHNFLSQFSDVKVLAAASLKDVLVAWSGLGYNRRAKFLHGVAQGLVSDNDWTYEKLLSYKGIGKNTAAAVRAYAYNEPQLFIETNVRSVFLHYFFPKKANVPDKDILPILARVIAGRDPRKFYWALMDLGAEIKKNANPNVRSRAYSKQSVFAGSLRQLRGRILRELTASSLSAAEISAVVQDSRLNQALASLVSDGLIEEDQGHYRLPV